VDARLSARHAAAMPTTNDKQSEPQSKGLLPDAPPRPPAAPPKSAVERVFAFLAKLVPTDWL